MAAYGYSIKTGMTEMQEIHWPEQCRKGFEAGYRVFENSVLLRQGREAAGIKQQGLGDRIGWKRLASPRLDNFDKDIKFFRFEK